MRMWMIPVKKLCNKHLVAEHGEIHAAVGNLRHSGTWANSLTEKGFLEPQNFQTRHNHLAKEMQTRGMNHQSPLTTKGLKLKKGKVNKAKSKQDLIKRCKNCRKRQKENKI